MLDLNIKPYAAVTLVAFVASFAFFGVDIVPNPLAPDVTPSTADSLSVDFARHGGRELSLVYIGSSGCRWSNLPELRAAVRASIELIQAHGASTGHHVSEVGVARDLDVRAGLQHLDAVADFDEVVAGRGWMNTGLLRYVYDRYSGIAATPQVLVVLRSVTLEPRRMIEAETLVARKVGAREIMDWVNAGAPLPSTTVSLSQMNDATLSELK